MNNKFAVFTVKIECVNIFRSLSVINKFRLLRKYGYTVKTFIFNILLVKFNIRIFSQNVSGNCERDAYNLIVSVIKVNPDIYVVFTVVVIIYIVKVKWISANNDARVTLLLPALICYKKRQSSRFFAAFKNDFCFWWCDINVKRTAYWNWNVKLVLFYIHFVDYHFAIKHCYLKAPL